MLSSFRPTAGHRILEIMRTRLLMFRSCMSLGRRGLHPHIHIGSIVSQQPLPTMRNYVNSMSSTTTSTLSFDAPEPPQSHGTPIFPDIQFENRLKPENQHAVIKRNSDSQAVFIVNGSSRGIGLQFVINLLERTKV